MGNSKKTIFSKNQKDIYCFADSPDIGRKLLDCGARIIQIRNKHIGDGEFLKLASEMVLLAEKYDDAVIIVNDRVNIALEAGADGVHVGQDDMKCREVVELAGENMIVGVSADNEKEAVEAQKAGADYVGAGAVFATATKTDAPVIGIEGLNAVVRSVDIPVVAIGGISTENISLIRDSGAKYFAVLSQICDSANISEKLTEFRKLII